MLRSYEVFKASRCSRDAQILASPGQRHHAPVVRRMIGNAGIEIFSRCFDTKYHRQYIAEQRRVVGEHSAM